MAMSILIFIHCTLSCSFQFLSFSVCRELRGYLIHSTVVQPSVRSMVCAGCYEATLFTPHCHAAFSPFNGVCMSQRGYLIHCTLSCSLQSVVCAEGYEATLFIAHCHAAFSPFYGVCKRLRGYLIHCTISCSLQSFLWCVQEAMRLPYSLHTVKQPSVLFTQWFAD